jgi:hypothetical protein
VEAVQKFMCLDLDSTKEMLFGMLDLNKDKQVCDTDAFQFIKLLNDPKVYQVVW